MWLLAGCGDPDKVWVYTTAAQYEKSVIVNVVYREALYGSQV